MAAQMEPVLSHMPFHVKQQIFGSADAQTQMSIRGCSKPLCEAVDNSESVYYRVNVRIAGKYVKVEVKRKKRGDQQDILIDHHKLGFQIEGYPVKSQAVGSSLHPDFTEIEKRLVKKKGNFLDRTVRFFEKLFKDPRKSVNEMRIWLNDDETDSDDEETDSETRSRQVQKTATEFLRKMKLMMERSPRLFPVKRLDLVMYSTEDMLAYIKFFQPGKLKKISLMKWHSEDAPEASLTEIAETEQWKQAKKVELSGIIVDVPYEKWAHLVWNRVKVESLDVDTLKRIVESFKLKLNWKVLRIKEKEQNQDARRYIQTLPKIRKRDGRRIDIPRSQWKIEVTADACITMRKYRSARQIAERNSDRESCGESGPEYEFVPGSGRIGSHGFWR